MSILGSKILKIIFAASTTFLISTYTAHSISLENIGIKGGMIWIGNTTSNPDEPVAAPHPVNTVIGVSFPIRFTSYFSLAPELRYYGQLYGIEYGRPVPVELESDDSSFVVGLLLEPRAVFDIQLIESLTLAVYASPTFLFRIPTRSWGEVDRGEIVAYQFGMGRYFYPEAGFAVDWELPFQIGSESAESHNGAEIHLVLDLSVYFPLFHAWDEEGGKFHDQFMASGVLGLRFFLPSPT
jgi:hypothetical protein